MAQELHMPGTAALADVLDALTGPVGQQVLQDVAAADLDTAPALRVAERLRRKYPPELVAAAMAQHQLRLAARTKFTRGLQMLFTRAGLEQASAEVIARHRALRYSDVDRVADLCTGIGGDLIALAAQSRTTLA